MANSQRKVPWRMTRKTFNLFMSLWEVASESEFESVQYHEAVEGMKMLPGYPNVCGDDVQFDPILIKSVTNLRPS